MIYFLYEVDIDTGYETFVKSGVDYDELHDWAEANLHPAQDFVITDEEAGS